MLLLCYMTSTAVKWSKICRKTAENRCWKTAETQLLENGRNIWDCRKTAEISAVFKQSTVFVGKWPKFWPFSYNMLLLFENGRNFGRFPTTPNVSAVFQQLCFGRFPTTVFGRFPKTVFGRFPTNFRPFYSSACHVT